MSKCKACAVVLIFALTGLINGIVSDSIDVLVKDSALISCSTNSSTGIQWHFNSDYNYVYAGGEFRDSYEGRLRLEIDPTTGNYLLIIPDVKPEDAGIYYCSEEISGQPISSTQLTVLHSNPVCTSNMSPDGFVGPNQCNLQQGKMTFNCAVSFNGKPPRLIWRSLNISQIFDNSTCENKDNIISCSLTLMADPSFDESVFVCETKGSGGPRYNCSTELIRVQYSYADHGNAKTTMYGHVSCWFRSNLNVKYNWTLIQNNQIIFLSTERTISIKNAGIHQCEAKYRIGSANCVQLISFVNKENKEHGNQLSATTCGLSIGVVSVIASVCAIFITIICLKLRRTTQLSTEETQPPEVLVPLNQCPQQAVGPIEVQEDNELNENEGESQTVKEITDKLKNKNRSARQTRRLLNIVYENLHPEANGE